MSDTTPQLSPGATLLRDVFRGGGVVYLCGCGGSAADSEHIAAEFMGRCSRSRGPLPAIALTSAANLTCIANDFGWNDVFSRQVRALAETRDLVVGLTTSARSVATLRALECARIVGARTLICSGDHEQGRIQASRCTLSYLAAAQEPGDIQEGYMAWWHRTIAELEATL